MHFKEFYDDGSIPYLPSTKFRFKTIVKTIFVIMKRKKRFLHLDILRTLILLLLSTKRHLNYFFTIFEN